MTTGTKVADVLHKTVISGLLVVTVVGLADVVRGFTVLTKRNVDRRSAPAAAPDAANSTGHKD